MVANRSRECLINRGSAFKVQGQPVNSSRKPTETTFVLSLPVTQFKTFYLSHALFVAVRRVRYRIRYQMLRKVADPKEQIT